jgi:DNA helicase HerA-like ATPase
MSGGSSSGSGHGDANRRDRPPPAASPPTPDDRLRLMKTHSNQNIWKEAYRYANAGSIKIGDKLLLRHVLILGSTGSGKTNHAFHIVQETLRDPSHQRTCFVIDVKREYRALQDILERDVVVLAVGDEPRLTFNPLIPPVGVETEFWDRGIADVFTRAYGLSEPSRRIMLDSLFKLREGQRESPTMRELEIGVSRFETASPREQSSKRSLESRLHIINTGPIGASLNSGARLPLERMEGKAVVFEVGRVDSLRDQRFVAEVLLLFLWYYDKFHPVEEEERVRRLIVVEEAHRYLSEERPSAQRGERTLLELAVAEARRYGWSFVIVDQMPLLLSRYVWDNMGTVIAHRLSNIESWEVTMDAIGGDPLRDAMHPEESKMVGLALPEDLALYRSYVEYPTSGSPSQGVMRVWKVK